jgi:hypothetical protein
MTSSPPSFDHLHAATRRAEHEWDHLTPIQAQIRRNGQLKYHRTWTAPRSEEIVMPDGEVIVRSSDD